MIEDWATDYDIFDPEYYTDPGPISDPGVVETRGASCGCASRSGAGPLPSGLLLLPLLLARRRA